ncbi:MAG: HNH endonuclease signature motif containing protein [Candidatus Binatia bacterium]|nr:HNH endonuclease signature motif containing protein [Candidatus Binatia bacterium]
MSRTTIPVHTRQLVLLEAGYKCANPTCRHVITLELHHIVWVKDDGDNDPNNLLALCPNCHSLHTHDHIPEQAIRTWKSLLLALNRTNHATADLLLILSVEEQRIEAASDATNIPPPFRFTGDGLPALSGLISSGLIEISKRYSGANAWGGSMPSFEVRLTAKGKNLVSAWRASSGDLGAILGMQS